MKTISDLRFRIYDYGGNLPHVKCLFNRQSATETKSSWAPRMRGNEVAIANRKSGSALVVVLWIIMIIALIVSAFSFEMQLEAKIITLQRKRFKADQLALAGVEMAKAMLAFKGEKNPTGEKIVYEDPYLNEAAKITNGVPVNYTEKLGDGEVTVKIDYEEGRRSIKNLMERPEEWRMLFELAGIPNTRWEAMLDCLADWQDDDGELHHLNGAESDDSFYIKRGYECKNAPLDTVEELLLIKNWDKEILYGTPPGEKTDTPITGIANLLTTWSDGKINPNSASTNVLNSMKIPVSMIDAILEGQAAEGGITQKDFDAMGLDARLFTLQPNYVKVTAIGTVAGVQSQISCIFKLGEKAAVPLFWLEGKTSE